MRKNRHYGALVALLVLSLCWPLTAIASGGGDGSGEGEKVEEKGSQYVKVGPINVPVLKDGRVIQYMLLVAALEVKNSEGAKEIESRMPIIKDAYLSSLYGALHVVGDDRNALVNLDIVRGTLESANKRILPEGLVTNVLLQQVEQRTR